MAFDEQFIHRIQEILCEKGIGFSEKAMFGGICILVNDKMLIGSHVDKETQENLLMCRVGEDAYERALEKPHVIPMQFTGKSMKGYVYVSEEGLKTKSELDYWLQLCLDYNPKAKKSKK